MHGLSSTARWFADELRDSNRFEVLSDGADIPVVAFRLTGDPAFTEFDLSYALRTYGWQVPAYTMPANAEDVSVLRVVVREGLSADLARTLRDDLFAVVATLDALKPRGHFNQVHPFAH
jgi:glutamate decarboxylase